MEGKISTISIRQKEQAQKGVVKSLGERSFWGSSSYVIFLGKGRRRMMSLSKWWEEGEWVGCLGYFERIEVNRIVLGA